MNTELKDRLERIKTYLGETGTPETNRVLADALGLTEQSIYALCRGQSKPRARTMKAIARLEAKLGIGEDV
jgi:transcriptional regulator with XRE-family HTH domain